MNRIMTALIAFLLLPVAQASNIEQGKQSAAVCAACHGAKGNSPTAIGPKLAGQHAAYLISQMNAFAAGEKRSDPSMNGLMQGLSQQDKENIASFYASQTVTVGAATPEDLKRGESLYRGGDFNKHIAACIACHGPRGLGNGQAGFPALGGQHPNYTVKQLLDFKQGKRKTDINDIMQDIAKRMDKKDMEAVANYIYGLH